MVEFATAAAGAGVVQDGYAFAVEIGKAKRQAEFRTEAAAQAKKRRALRRAKMTYRAADTEAGPAARVSLREAFDV